MDESISGCGLARDYTPQSGLKQSLVAAISLNSGKVMKEAKNVVVRLEGRAFVFEVDIAEEDLISEMISSLSLFIKRGFPIKVIQTSAPSMGRSQSMWTRILTSIKELGEWVEDLKRLARIHRGKP
jgi:hypothetical protein